MNSTSKDSQEWVPCDSGLLVGLSRQAKHSRRKQLAFRMAGAAVVVVGAIGLGIWGATSWPGSQENYFGGIACHEVRELMPQLASGTISDDVKQKIEIHMKECSACQEYMRRMQGEPTAASSLGVRSICQCDECRRRRSLERTTAHSRIEQGNDSLSNSWQPLALLPR